MADLGERALRRYLGGWLQQAVTARRRPVHLWFVVRASEAIAARDLRVLADVAAPFADGAHGLTISAAFIEPDPAAYHRLLAMVAREARTVASRVVAGAAELAPIIGDDPALLRVDVADATGAPLLAGARHDVLVDTAGGFEPLALKRDWQLALAAELPAPPRRWILITNQPAALRLFRDVERDLHDERPAASRAGRRRSSSQLPLAFAPGPPPRPDLDQLERALLEALAAGPRTFAAMAPPILERLHVTWDELAAQTCTSAAAGVVRLPGLAARERRLSPQQVVTLPLRLAAGRANAPDR